MRVFVSKSRTLLILLLALRVLAAPVAMRPEPNRFPAHFRLVPRVCAWPTQPPRRSLTRASLAPCFLGKHPGNIDPGGKRGRSYLRGSTDWTVGSRLPGSDPKGLSSGQHTVRLRC